MHVNISHIYFLYVEETSNMSQMARTNIKHHRHNLHLFIWQMFIGYLSKMTGKGLFKTNTLRLLDKYISLYT